MLWALVPVKELTRSKQRLAEMLGQDERKALVLAMLRDVLTAIQDSSEFDGILLVSRSRQVQVAARDFVSDIFIESRGSDHSQAVTEANRYLIDRHAVTSSLAISADIPRVTARDIRQIMRHHDRLTLVPNETGEGTNAILASPPNAIASHFGGPSLERHIKLADDAGLSPVIVRNMNVAMDIDEPLDLERAATELPPTFTRDFLRDSGVAARLNIREESRVTPAARMRIAGDQWA